MKASGDQNNSKMDCETAPKVTSSEKDSGISRETPPLDLDLETGLAAAKEDNDMDEEDNGSTGTLEDESSKSPSTTLRQGHHRTLLVSALILLLGTAAAAAFTLLGVTGAMRESSDQFSYRASELVTNVQNAWQAYETAGLYLHNAGSRGRANETQPALSSITRTAFREVYEYLVASGLEMQAASFNPNVTHAERAAVEDEAREFYAVHYPTIDYTGIRGVEPDPDVEGAFRVQARSEQPFYFPVHWMEPVVGNEGALDFDLFSSASRRATIDVVLRTWAPALTPRLNLVQEATQGSYGVILMHPGVRLSTRPSQSQPRDFSSVVIRIPDLLRAATSRANENVQVYLYDSTDEHAHYAQEEEDGVAPTPEFLGGASVVVDSDGVADVRNLPERAIDDHEAHAHRRVVEIEIATRRWKIVMMTNQGANKHNIVLASLGGGIIFASCVCLTLWVYTNMRRHSKMDQIKQAAASEKAALIVEHALQAAKSDRELNDFIAHEVRNPLAAAMSACNFVSSAVNETQHGTEASRASVREDVTVIESSLHFINDLLRNMLDMQRASSNQLQLKNAPTDVLRDVLQPIDSMLYRRDGTYEVQIECPDNLVVSTDALRLKQIVLNLGRNSGKFVEHGFIRFRAAVVDGNVRLYIEDSGPGIPNDKREILFTKFQESLDTLSQGTGIGLSLCMQLSELMGAHVWFDDSYESGVPGCPGSRFVIDLQTPPVHLDDKALDAYSLNTGSLHGGGALGMEPPACTLPERLSVLFVDDDLILRKLFNRSVKRVAPTWKFKEAANGETALRMAEVETFDLIFMDQYMAAAEKQLLGTETTRALRSKGVDSLVCGLSANDCEEAFYSAGADAFMHKPFPCEKESLTRELRRVLDTIRDRDA